ADAAPGATAQRVASLGARHVGRGAWSPDGQELAFGETFVAVTERIPIRVVSVDGGETRILIEAEAEGANLDPEWSPDGSRIAMFSFRKSFDLYTVPLDGGSWTRLTTSPSYDTSNHEPAWSPDGTRIAYATVRNGRRDLRLVSATGGTPVVLTDDAAEDWTPTWSPDGTAIAFSTDRSGNFEIWVMPVEPR
ncbi:MAG: PD40 domain-containing protein, partial [Candidatus Eisenbacteria bacterium]|nr:PD40 domain-containing protein [Candidatus Eisenbacteria bacterium]